MNNSSDFFNFLNVQLHEALETFSKTLPKDAVWDTFKILLESLKFALINGENPSRLSKRIRRERHRKKPSLTPLSPTQAQLDIAEANCQKLIKKLACLLSIKCWKVPDS